MPRFRQFPFCCLFLAFGVIRLCAQPALSPPALSPPASTPTAPAAGVAEVWSEAGPPPRRFPRITDENGCRWGLVQDGAIALSGSAAHPTLSLFHHAARLTVNGEAFLPESAATSPEFDRIRLTGRAGSVPVVRDVWIDRDRGAARISDTFANAGAAPLALTVVHETQFDQPVPAIHRGDGGELEANATETRDGVMAFLQNQPEGMSSAIMIVGDATSPSPPRWRGKKNAEQQAIEWRLAVPGPGAATVVAWVIQRPTLSAAELKRVASNFLRSGRLVRPRLDAAAIASLINFPARGVSAAGDAIDPGDPSEMLAPLVRLAERLGIERGAQDMYAMNPKSVLEGEATGDPLVVVSRLGKLTVPLAEVAAVQGGGGRGRWPRVFLRDGHVLSGEVDLPQWKISGAKGWTIPLRAATLEALVMRASPIDGVAAEPPNFLAQLTSGDTLPLRLAPDESLSLVTPWGPLVVPVSELTGLWRRRESTPSFRLTLRNGSRLTALPMDRELNGHSSRLGPLKVPQTDLTALWPTGGEPPDTALAEAEVGSLDDLDDFGEAVVARALLRGSTVIGATLAEPGLTLFSSGTEMQLSTSDLVTIKRSEGSSDSAPIFTLTLSDGASFDGSLRGGSVDLKTRGGSLWSVPLSQFLGWEQAATEKSHSPTNR